ncbi:LysR family transcriptional regulator [Vibrio agarivorans]|uniref:LysR family transcriptional regulator n=1 Tax=Vibrio agarivorans TaxID=153622 RepID=A0ABT7XZ14_9VIBR|nr:LysR family transcriptional regulator [Vibrio agarivorans]MDN2481023.1 LysR family transcriptional regulator [Vibrio agarivorans]
MYRFLPHSHKAFRVFKCVARHMSFTHAAQELYVTQGAVSRQVKQLEEFLGTELVVRKHRSIELTERGKALSKLLVTQYTNLDQLIASWKYEMNNRITIKASLSFATRFLIPKIQYLNEKFPDHEVVVVPVLEDTNDFSTNDCDLLISCTRLRPEGDNVFYLRDEYMAPVCAIPSTSQNVELDYVFSQPRIHATQDHFDWHHWIKVTQYPDIHRVRHTTFFTLELALSACLAGQGVTVTDLMLILPELEQGYLTAPVGLKMTHSDWRYYCHVKDDSPILKELSDWLKAETDKEVTQLKTLMNMHRWQVVGEIKQ